MGGEQHLLELAETLARRGEVVYLYTIGAPPSSRDLHWAGGRGVSLLFRPGAAAPAVAEEAVRMRPDLMLVHGPHGLWEACAAVDAPCPRIALVHYWAGLVPDPVRVDTSPDPLPAVAALAAYDGVVANSTYTRDVLVGLGLDPARVVVEMPISPEAPQFVGSARDGGASGRSGALVVGGSKMRAPVIAALARSVPGGLRQIEYDHAGSTDALEPAALARVYDEVAVLAHPTFLVEAFGRVAVEAMAHGLPVVYPDRGNLPRLIGRGAGIAVAGAATPAEWVAAVGRAVTEGDWRGRWARRRAGWLLEYAGDKLAIDVAAERAIARLPIVTRPAVTLPVSPGPRTAALHLGAVHGADFVDRPGPGRGLLLLGCPDREWFGMLPDVRRTNPGGGVFLWWHSNLAQSSLDGEAETFHDVVRIVEQGFVDGVLTTDASMVELFAAHGVPAGWLPDVVAPRLVTTHDEPSRSHACRVGLFSSGVPRKNLLVALGAASIAGAEFHTSSTIAAQRGFRAAARALRVEVREHEVPPHRPGDVHRLMASMTCTLHPSFAETFCYSAAESILAGAPAVGSPAVPVLAGVERDDDVSVVRGLEDAGGYAQRIRALHADAALRARVLEEQRLWLGELSFRNELVGRRTLTRIIRPGALPESMRTEPWSRWIRATSSASCTRPMPAATGGSGRTGKPMR
jgi:glycosyltransferase involved in cell wall biosynthesis